MSNKIHPSMLTKEPAGWAHNRWLPPPQREADYEVPHAEWHPLAREAHEAADANYEARKGKWNEPGAPNTAAKQPAKCHVGDCRQAAGDHGHCWCCGAVTRAPVERNATSCPHGCPDAGDVHYEQRCRHPVCFARTVADREGMTFADVAVVNGQHPILGGSNA